MSASRVKFLSAKAKQSKDESEEEDYDSEEERYRWKQQRLLQKVEETASFIREVNAITRPFVTGTWRLEREEQRIAEQSAQRALESSQENKLQSMFNPTVSWTEPNDLPDKIDSSRRKSVWSPIKHVKTTDVHSVLEMEKTPNWKPLRKSKARQSLAFSNAANTCESPKVLEVDLDSSQKVLGESMPPSKALMMKVSEEVRTPLKVVAALNQPLCRRKSTTVPNESTFTPRVSESESHAIIETTNGENDSVENCPALSLTNGTDFKELIPCKSSSMDKTEVHTPINKTRSFVKNFKSPVRCSPILLQAYGEEYCQVRGSIGSPDKVVNLNDCSSPKDPSKVLRGVTAYVEVRRGEDDRTAGFKWKLKQLGATVSDTLNRKVTHVVFQEGLLSTFRKATQLGAHLVSTHWVMACDESFTKAKEVRYPIEKLSQYETADPLQKCIKRPKIMSPDLSSGKDEKLLSRRLQRRSIKVNSPLTQTPIRSIKTPSPLKIKSYLKRTTPSPKSSQTSDNNSDDDWDGFLAMVESQIREKAQSRKRAGEMNETMEDFETRLQRILGRGDDQSQDKMRTSPPLASIFQRGKVSSSLSTKASPKKTKKTKQCPDSAASTSVMMNWLQRRSPEIGQTCKSGDLSSVSAAVAASAAADEILKSMFTSTLTEKRSMAVFDSADKVFNTSQNPTHKTARAEVPGQSSTAEGTTGTQEPFIFTAKPEHSKLSQPAKKLTKKNKLEFQGSAACSDAMLNWLSGVKSLTQPNKSTIGSILLCGQENGKRKAVSPIKIESDVTSGNICDTILLSVNPCKRNCDKVTPEKQPPLEENGSAVKSGRKKTLDLTPRRRSMRLTPNKSTSHSSNITQLETVEESKVSIFKSEAITPLKQSSMGKTQGKCSFKNTSAPLSASSKYLKSQKSCRKRNPAMVS